jgi:hypothetical protein
MKRRMISPYIVFLVAIFSVSSAIAYNETENIYCPLDTGGEGVPNGTAGPHTPNYPAPPSGIGSDGLSKAIGIR